MLDLQYQMFGKRRKLSDFFAGFETDDLIFFFFFWKGLSRRWRKRGENLTVPEFSKIREIQKFVISACWMKFQSRFMELFQKTEFFWKPHNETGVT